MISRMIIIRVIMLQMIKFKAYKAIEITGSESNDGMVSQRIDFVSVVCEES